MYIDTFQFQYSGSCQNCIHVHCVLYDHSSILYSSRVYTENGIINNIIRTLVLFSANQVARRNVANPEVRNPND